MPARAGRPASKRRTCRPSFRARRRDSYRAACVRSKLPVPRATDFHVRRVRRCTSNGRRGETSARSFVPSTWTTSRGATSTETASPGSAVVGEPVGDVDRRGARVGRKGAVGLEHESVGASRQPGGRSRCWSRARPRPRTYPGQPHVAAEDKPRRRRVQRECIKRMSKSAEPSLKFLRLDRSSGKARPAVIGQHPYRCGAARRVVHDAHVANARHARAAPTWAGVSTFVGHTWRGEM